MSWQDPLNILLLVNWVTTTFPKWSTLNNYIWNIQIQILKMATEQVLGLECGWQQSVALCVSPSVWLCACAAGNRGALQNFAARPSWQRFLPTTLQKSPSSHHPRCLWIVKTWKWVSNHFQDLSPKLTTHIVPRKWTSGYVSRHRPVSPVMWQSTNCFSFLSPLENGYGLFPRYNIQYLREVGRGWFGQVIKCQEFNRFHV